jgi:hypothetical protein
MKSLFFGYQTPVGAIVPRWFRSHPLIPGHRNQRIPG